MLVSLKHKKVLINTKYPQRITAVIPTARVLEYKGRPLVAVPHELDEVRVLRNLGFSAPSPIAHYYKWSGQYTPFYHQQHTAEFLTLNQRAFVLNQIGTGKTLSVLWAIDYLKRVGYCKKVIIVSPLSTLERVWADELFRHFPHLEYTVLHGTAEKRRKLLALDVDVYIINHDGVKVLQKELAARPDIDVVVVDEIAEFRNASTDRWKCLSRLCAARPWVWGLTASPTPKAPTDAWAQCRLLVPDKVPKYFGRFRDTVMRQVTTFKWTARENANQMVMEAMQPAILYKRDECLDLPPCTYSTRHVDLSPEQAKAYKDMVNKLKVEAEGGQITAVNEAVKQMKLVQIACGVAYTTEGEHVIFPAQKRIDEVQEIVEQAEGKVILYVPLTGGLEMIAKAVSEMGYKTAIVYGETPKRERDAIYRAFQDERDPLRVLIAHPKCMAHGLTLTSASVIIWYIPTNDFSIYEQACGRIVRQGQTRSQHIIHLEGTVVERRMYQRLEQRDMGQCSLLDLIKEEMETA